jgi:hypothetical protein
MQKIILLVCFTTGFLSNWSIAQPRDSLVLYNGQELIGAVQGASLGVISIDDIDLKIQTIKLYKIRILKIFERFKIESVDKKFYYGTLNTSTQEGWVDIHTDDGMVVSMPITSIYLLISVENNFFKRVNGNVSAGLSFTKSSGIGQVNFAATVQFATKSFEYQLTASAISSIDTGTFSRDNENLQLFAAYDLTASWFLAGVGQYQRNLELSIARRYLEMLGTGNKLVIKKNWQLMVVTGLDITQEKSTEGVSSGALFEIPVMFRFNYYQFHHPDIQISSAQSGYISLSEKGRIRYDGNTNFSWQLIRYFYLTISPYTNFDSKPPQGSGSKFDFGIVVGVSYKF